MRDKENVVPEVMKDLVDRMAKGTKEYGVPLHTNNGRCALQDAYEEVLDLACYLKQAMMEQRDRVRVKEFTANLSSLT